MGGGPGRARKAKRGKRHDAARHGARAGRRTEGTGKWGVEIWRGRVGRGSARVEGWIRDGVGEGEESAMEKGWMPEMLAKVVGIGGTRAHTHTVRLFPQDAPLPFPSRPPARPSPPFAFLRLNSSLPCLFANLCL